MDRRPIWLLAAALLCAGALAAQEPPAEPAQPAQEPTPEVVEDVIVVTASRTEQPINEAPATVTVLSAAAIEDIPADDYGDLLRNVAGLNVSQTSAREINITSRGSTNTLSTSQLVLLDGRSIYLDFFGFVMWDFLPINTTEIKQIEVVQGPASAVWGANAMTGVINLITKRPKEMVGTSVLLGGGERGTKYGGVTHAGVSGNLGYKVSGSYYEQDPYDRPTGNIPGTTVPFYSFPNEGTEQPKGDLRFDWDLEDDSVFTVGAGYAGTSGIVHTGIGPFSVDNGSYLSYAKADYNRQALHVGLFGNFLSADSKNFLSSDLAGNPLPFAFDTDTYNLDVSNVSPLGNYTLLTYGANARTSNFDLEIAPLGTGRDEYGGYLQAEVMFGQKVRWIVGARYDDVEVVDPVVSPRTTLMFAPNANHTLRLSFNRAFRAPSVINNYLQATIQVPIAPFPITVTGNPDLTEESLDAYEVSYSASLPRRLQLTLAVYRNKTTDSIDFFQKGVYTFENPPPGAPAALRPCFLFNPGTNPACPFGGLRGIIPSLFSYRNIGETTDEGAELSLSQRIGERWSWFANYSYQKEPDVKGVPAADVNVAPESRYNLGLSYDAGSFFANASVNHADEAYWTDVLNIRGTTDAYTQVNASFGFRFFDERVTLSVIGSNLTDEDVQQHIFGDVIGRRITGQVGFRF